MDDLLPPEDPHEQPIEELGAKRRGISPWVILGGLVLGAVVVTNVMLLNRVGDLQDELDAGLASIDGVVSDLDSDVSNLASSVSGVADMVDEFETQLDNINVLAIAGSGEASAAPELIQGVPAGSGLPRFDPSVQDPALGTHMAGMAGPEYYTGQTLEIDAADGTARAWLVWAHWCPYCQQEMPELKAWVEANAAAFPNFEVVSVTTAMDESRGNSLIPYLDELQLPFPVIVDEDGLLSSQLGLNAFPFWVFTGPDGTVLGRTAGLLGPDRFASIFRQLQDIAAA